MYLIPHFQKWKKSVHEFNCKKILDVQCKYIILTRTLSLNKNIKKVKETKVTKLCLHSFNTRRTRSDIFRRVHRNILITNVINGILIFQLQIVFHILQQKTTHFIFTPVKQTLNFYTLFSKYFHKSFKIFFHKQLTSSLTEGLTLFKAAFTCLMQISTSLAGLIINSFSAWTPASLTNAAKSAPVNPSHLTSLPISSTFTSSANLGLVPFYKEQN